MPTYLVTTLILAVSFASIGIAMVLAPTVESADAANQRLTTGVTTTDIGSQEQLGFDRIRKAGAKMTRVIIYWSSVAPAAKPGSWNPTDPGDSHYSWAEFDSQLRMAVNAGLTPMVQIFSAPKWAERCKSSTAGICNPNPKAFARFSKAAAKRYSGTYGGLPRVRYWEPLNEPNLPLFFKPQYKNGKKVSPTLYRNLLNRFAGTVKGVKAGNKVIAGGLAPLERPGGLGPLDFARRVLCMTGRKHPKPERGCHDRARFDIWAVNPYTTGGPTHESAGPDDVSLGDLPEMGKLLRAANSAGKIKTGQNSIPLWVTEFSWDSKPPDPGGVPMGLLTRWTSEAMFRAWQSGVSKFFWLSLRDWPSPKGLPYSETMESGLYFRGTTLAKDRPKRILKAFHFPFVAFGKESGISVWGRTAASTGGKVALSFRTGGSWKRIGTAKADRNGIFRSVIKTRLARKLGRKKRGDVRATYHGQTSRSFSLRPVKDRYQPPFG
ncbi:MAG: hypothetical protein JJE13_04450 [Thermoleophilia bacterium]|nr:hypothetical protein [Thermoleophilia bacterium]